MPDRSKTDLSELGERVVSHLYQENSGPDYRRLGYLKEIALEAMIEASLTPTEVCDFKNQWGWCLLEKGHEGSHTVVWLGED